MTKFLALLRGINVGGKNIIKMVDLKACFIEMGFSNVLTFIQSGNVIFDSDISDKIKLTDQIERTFSLKFNYNSLVVLISKVELEEILKNSPANFGTLIDEYKYDVVFVKEPYLSSEVYQYFQLKDGVDEVYEGENVLYLSKLIKKAGQSKLSKIIKTPVYNNITIRNWNTTSKLLALMQ